MRQLSSLRPLLRKAQSNRKVDKRHGYFPELHGIGTCIKVQIQSLRHNLQRRHCWNRLEVNFIPAVRSRACKALPAAKRVAGVNRWPLLDRTPLSAVRYESFTPDATSWQFFTRSFVKVSTLTLIALRRPRLLAAVSLTCLAWKTGKGVCQSC